MFPERVRNVCGKATDLSISSTKALYTFSCNASWIFFTSSMILFAPVLCEVELAQMIEMQRSQQKQVQFFVTFRKVLTKMTNQFGKFCFFFFLRCRFYSDQVRLFRLAVDQVCHHCRDNFEPIDYIFCCINVSYN